MLRKVTGLPIAALALSTIVPIGLTIASPAPVQAQTTTHHHTVVRHRRASFIHRHPNATAAAAGVAAYKIAKHQHHGFMHRHPYLTGAAAAVAAHHYAKKHH